MPRLCLCSFQRFWIPSAGPLSFLPRLLQTLHGSWSCWAVSSASFSLLFLSRDLLAFYATVPRAAEAQQELHSVFDCSPECVHTRHCSEFRGQHDAHKFHSPHKTLSCSRIHIHDPWLNRAATAESRIYTQACDNMGGDSPHTPSRRTRLRTPDILPLYGLLENASAATRSERPLCK